MHKPEDIATRLLGKPYAALDARTQKVALYTAKRRHIARDLGQVATGTEEAATTFGQRAADAVASFGGSWLFVGLFILTLVVWIGTNAYLLTKLGKSFDPYPYILLNLFLSMLAAIQAPVILMSQNRQAEKDRATAGHDYEVNLKAELEIMLLHEKIDQLREKQWGELVEMQQTQLKLLAALAVVRSD